MSQLQKIDSSPLSKVAISRRSFLRFSALGTTAVATTGVVGSLSGCSNPPNAAKGFSFLRDGDLQLFTALIPVVVGDVLQTESHNYQALVVNILRRVDGACAALGNHAQGEIHKLLDLLDGRITRWLTTGVSAKWPETKHEDVSHFLIRWRDSSISPFNAGYRVLSKLVAVSYYSLPESKIYSGYPGPMASMYQVVNA